MAISEVTQQVAGATTAANTNFPAVTIAVNDYLLVTVHIDSHSAGSPGTGTVTDGHNLWSLLGSTQSSAGGHAQRTEVWSTLSSFAGSVTVNIAIAGGKDDYCGILTVYRGVDTTVPILDALSFATNYTSTVQSASFTQTITTTGAWVIAFYGSDQPQVGIPSGFSHNGGVSAGAGAVNSNSGMGDKIGTAGSLTYNWGSSNWYAAGGLTLKPFTVTESGTIRTTLTKASMSLAGLEKVAGTATTTLRQVSQSGVGKTDARGTITTTLTKASMLAAAKEIFTGTVSTNLTKVSQALSSKEIVTGSVVTLLSKASQLATGSATSVESGTITMHLSGISQSLTSAVPVTGTVTTTLRGVNISAAAKEIVTGVAVTNIDGAVAFAIDATAEEIIRGNVVTVLQPFAQMLQAQEIVVGQAITNMGGTSGSLVGVAVEALEIIEGPIVMNLKPFKHVALAAQLGPPGGGKWYSWRYADR